MSVQCFLSMLLYSEGKVCPLRDNGKLAKRGMVESLLEVEMTWFREEEMEAR